MPSWNEGATKTAIVTFVHETTDTGQSQVRPARASGSPPSIRTARCGSSIRCTRRWSTASTGCRRSSDIGPHLKDIAPFKTVLSGDREAIAKLALKDLEEILAATLSGMTVEEFDGRRDEVAGDRPASSLACDPTPSWRISRCSKCCSYFRANGFKTYIVTGGGQDFVRVYAERIYGIPPEQVVGTTGGTKYAYGKHGEPVLFKEPKLAAQRQQRRQAGGDPPDDRPPARAPRSATRPAIARCWSTRAPATAARLMMLVLHDDAGPRVRLRTGPGPAQQRKSALSPQVFTTRRRVEVGS